MRLLSLFFTLACSGALAAESPSSSAKARFQNIEQLLNDWDTEGAARELAELEKQAPGEVESALYFRGRIAFEEGRYEDAIESLGRAKLADKPGSYLRLAKDTAKLVLPYAQEESEHFIFLYPKGKDALLAPYALEALEAQARALKDDLGWLPPGKTRVEIVSNSDELARLSTLTAKQIRTTGTIAICKFSKLMVTSPKAVVKGYDWLDTLAHEYTHLVVSQKSKNTVPIWLHEGLAKYLESRWRGPAGGAMTPSGLALLGSRVRKNTLVPFSKMHPSMALLPTAEDAATAFAEVYFALDWMMRQGGAPKLRALLELMAAGEPDKRAVEKTFSRSWASFEKAWLEHIRSQKFPEGLVPRSSNEKKQLVEGKSPPEGKKGREISFGDFAEVTDVDARQEAHLGELMRERKRQEAAVEYFSRAVRRVGFLYESVSNKYALTLMELTRLDEAKEALEGTLKMHPGSAQSQVHLGRLLLRKRDYAAAKDAYRGAIAVNPFDYEVQVGLLRACDALKDSTCVARSQKAASLLLKRSETEVLELARRFSRDGSLVEADEEFPASEIRDAG